MLVIHLLLTIASTLRNLEVTKNRNVFDHEFAVSQGQYLDVVKRYAKPETKWSVVKREDADTELDRRAGVLTEKCDMASIFLLIKGALLSR
jgi:hypothetical protein